MKRGSTSITSAKRGSTSLSKVYRGSTIVWSSGPSYDSDAQAFITATGISDTTQQTAINDLVVGLKADSLWNKFVAIYPMVGGTATTHKYNLLNPADTNAAFRLQFNGGWTHSATGATPVTDPENNFFGGYANTFINPYLHLSTDGAGGQTNGGFMGYYSRTQTTGTPYDVEMGIQGGDGSFFMAIRWTDGEPQFIAINGAQYLVTPADNNTKGWFNIQRNSSTEIEYRRNNSIQHTITDSPTGYANGDVLLGAYNLGLTNPYFSTSKECAFAVVGKLSLTSTERTNLYNRIQVFQTALNRAIYDSDAEAFITAAGITDNTQKIAINELVAGLKTDGLWTRLDAIYPMVGGTANAHKYNLKDPRDLDAAYRLSFNGGWTHSATGAQPDGTTAWADTFYVPSVEGIPNTLGYYSRTNFLGDNSYELGINATTSDVGLQIFNSNDSTGRFEMASATGTTSTTTITDTRGWFMVNRTVSGATGITLRQNATQLASVTLALQTPYASSSVYLAARRNAIGGGFASTSQRECAFAVIGWSDILSTTRRTNLYNRIQTFQTTLGRQV